MTLLQTDQHLKMVGLLKSQHLIYRLAADVPGVNCKESITLRFPSSLSQIHLL
jgi:hypothetical protein